MHLHPLPTEAFHLRPAANEGSRARLRTIKGARFTSWGEMDLPLTDGVAQLPEGAILMAVIHRHGRAEGLVQLAVLEGWGRWRGALATTVSHDSHNLTLFGREPTDLATAANALIASGGGMAVAAGGAVRAHLPLPIAGLVSENPTATVARDFATLRHAADEIAPWQPPLRVFKAVVGATLACNPGPHLTDRGLTDGTTQEVFPTGSP